MTDTSNLTIGQAEIYFREGVASPTSATMPDTQSLGNIVTSGINPEVSYVEHYSRIKGKKVKDEEFVITNGLNINFTFDEINKENVKKFLLGGDIEATASRMPAMLKNGIRGRSVLKFNTNVGEKFLYVIPKCVLKSDGGMNLTSDKWVEGNFKLDILYHNTYHVGNDSNASQAPFGYIDFDTNVIGSPF